MKKTLPNLLICSAVFFSPPWALAGSVSDSLITVIHQNVSFPVDLPGSRKEFQRIERLNHG
jgi:hypothetical protein